MHICCTFSVRRLIRDHQHAHNDSCGAVALADDNFQMIKTYIAQTAQRTTD